MKFWKEWILVLRWKVSYFVFYVFIKKYHLEYLMGIDLSWLLLSRSTVPRFTRVSNNFAEHVNSTYVKAQSLDIIHAFYVIHSDISTKHYQRSENSFHQNQGVVQWNKTIFARTQISFKHQVRRTGYILNYDFYAIVTILSRRWWSLCKFTIWRDIYCKVIGEVL